MTNDLARVALCDSCPLEALSYTGIFLIQAIGNADHVRKAFIHFLGTIVDYNLGRAH